MAEKGLGKATLKVERVCALLDPRRKSLDNSQIVNGSAALRTRAEEDVKVLIETFAGEHTPSPASLPESSAASDVYKRQDGHPRPYDGGAKKVRDVLLEVMAEKGLGKATLNVER